MNRSTRSVSNSNPPALPAPAPGSLANDMAVEILPLSAMREPDRQIRVVSERAIAAATAMMEQWGQLIPIALSDDGIVIAGFEFFLAARKLGLTSIKAVRLSQLSREHAPVVTIALARLPQLSAWDEDALRLEFQDLINLDLGFDLHDLVGFSVGEMDVILEADPPGDQPNPLDSLPEVPGPEQTVSRVGDLWNMGSHRLICGNALEAQSYALLIGDRVVRMVFSDPPYGIKIKGNVSRKHEDFAMGVGEQTSEEFTAFLQAMIVLALVYLVDGGLVFLFMDRRHLLELQVAAQRAGLGILDLCIWNKLTGGMGGLYRSQFEPVFVFKHGAVRIARR